MKSKMKECKVCGAEIANNAAACPKCGAKNKKPFYKKWWIWVLVFMMLVLLTPTDTEGAEVNEPDIQITESKQNDITTTAKEEEIKAEEPEPILMYKWLAAEVLPFDFGISDKSIEFIKENINFFPGKNDIKGAISDYVNNEITYEHLTKNPSKYGDELIEVCGTVIDIFEAEDGSYTYVQVMDYSDRNYIMLYLGTLDNIFEGTEVYSYVLPFDVVKFENMGGEYTEAIIGAACYVDDLVNQ